MSHRGKKSRITKKNNKPQVSPDEKLEGKTWFNKSKSILFFIAGILAFMINYDDFYDKYFKTQRQKFSEENLLEGTVTSAKVFEYVTFDFGKKIQLGPLNDNIPLQSDTLPPVKGIYVENFHLLSEIPIQIGGTVSSIPIRKVYDGVELFHPIFSGCTRTTLHIKAIEDRIFVSAKFVDLQDNAVGNIDYNKWTLYKNKFANYNEEDDKFEVLDKNGLILFSISYRKRNGKPWIMIAGYFNGRDNVIVLNSVDHQSDDLFRPEYHYCECIPKRDSNWQLDVWRQVSQIQSVFNN